jgi:hypothetical protein
MTPEQEWADELWAALGAEPKARALGVLARIVSDARDSGVAAERERCARLADAGAAHESSRAAAHVAGRIAAAIREGREP